MPNGQIHGEEYLTLETSGTHDQESHVEDQSKFLKAEQIADVHRAVHVAPTFSATTIRRNLAVFEP